MRSSRPDGGLKMLVSGAGLSALGLVLTFRLRSSKKAPQPDTDVATREKAIPLSPHLVRFAVVAIVLVGAGLVFWTPNGRSPESLRNAGFIAAGMLALVAGVAQSGWIFLHSRELYADWRER